VLDAIAVLVRANDLARVVDAKRMGAIDGQGMIQSRVDAAAVKEAVGPLFP
jgi:hypothetical protein